MSTVTVTGLPPATVLDDVFVTFPGAAGPVVALRGTNLAIAAGERLLIQGPNGSGKSTLLRVLTGEQQVSAGRVVVGGVDLTDLSRGDRRRWRRSAVGIADQHARRALLPEWNVLENVALQLRVTGMGPAAAVAAARRTLDELGLGRLADRAIGSLSGGEAQRVAVCAALAHDPALLLADEPTTELDDEAAGEVYRLLGRAAARSGASVVLVSHDPRATGGASRAIRLRDGRVADEWTPGSAEHQVVDARGWLRLPNRARPVGLRSVHITGTPDAALVTPTDVDPTAVEAPTLLPPAPTAVLPVQPEPRLELRGLTARVGNRELFTGLDATVGAGRLVGLRGPSGTGKSTLLRIAAGLQDPAAGTVLLGGTDLTGLDRSGRAELRARSMAMVTQSTILADDLTVAENLRFAADLRGRDGGPELADLLAGLDLTALRDRSVRVLSGGERQRVAVARCLITRAPLLVFDEPTSQQDEFAAALVARQLVGATRRGAAVLVATHDARLLEHADSTIELGRRHPGSDAAPNSAAPG